MYTNFSVEGYRGLGRLHLPRLGPVAVVTGRNDVGKSALLEAMFLHGCGATAGATALTVLRPMRRLPVVGVGAEGHLGYPWAPLFPGMDTSQDVALSATVGGEQRQLRLSVPPQSRTIPLGRGGTGIETDASLDVVTVIGGRTEHLRQNVTVENGGGSVRLASNPADPAPWYDVRIVKGVGAVPAGEAFSALRRAGRDEELVAALRAVDPRVQGVELLVTDGAPTLHAHLPGKVLMPFSALGDGLNSAMTSLLAVSASRGGLVLLDEVEEGLHHSALPGVWRSLVAAARTSEAQLVVTTHSEEAIAAAAEAMDDHVGDLTLVRLDAVEVGPDPTDDEARTARVEAVTYTGRDVAAAVRLAVEVR